MNKILYAPKITAKISGIWRSLNKNALESRPGRTYFTLVLK